MSFFTASIAALPTMNVTRLEYAPMSTGVKSVSAATTRIASSSTPSSSATTYASSESEPCPMSEAPQNTVTRPERSARSCTALCGMSFG